MSEMIKISEAASIALHACAWLALQGEYRGRSAEICRELGFSAAHFVKVMQALSRAGLVESRRGPAGGSRLTRTPDGISLLEIYEAIEGPLCTERCLLPAERCRSRACVLGAELRHHHRALRAMMASTRLDTLAASLAPVGDAQTGGAVRPSRKPGDGCA